MKKVFLGDKVTVSDVPVPGIGVREVLVETAYSFISSGTELSGVKSASSNLIDKVKSNPERITKVLDMVRVNGVKKTFIRVKDKLESRGPIGYSCAGKIIAKGQGVNELSIGDRVACGGQGYASHGEVVAVPRNLVCRLPEGCDLKAASGATIASIALQGVRRAGLQLGETAVVLGLGLLGQITLQLLDASGVNVIGFDIDEYRVNESIKNGFQNCFVVTGRQACDEVIARTCINGADAVLITAASSSDDICQNAMEMTRKKGKVVVVGAVPLKFDRNPFYKKEIDFLVSCSYGPGRYDPVYEQEGHDYPYSYVRWTENRNLQAILEMISKGKLDITKLISAEYDINQADAAFRALSSETRRPLAVVLKYEFSDNKQSSKFASNISLKPVKRETDKISVGIIGAGQLCRGTHLPSFRIFKDKYSVDSICDLNSAVAQDLARQYGAYGACSDPKDIFDNHKLDLVVITTRHSNHAELAIRALQSDKHVFVEKPMAINKQQLEDLKKVIAESSRYYMVGFNRRFSPHVSRLKKKLKNRASPVTVNYRVIADQIDFNHWIYSEEGGRRVVGEACHMFDLFNYLVGSDAQLVEFDTLASPVGRVGPAGDNFIVSVRYSDGSLCTLSYTTLGKKSKDIGKERVEIFWDTQTYLIDDFKISYGNFSSKLKVASKGHTEQMKELANYLIGNREQPIDVNDAINATEISFAVDQACQEVVSV